MVKPTSNSRFNWFSASTRRQSVTNGVGTETESNGQLYAPALEEKIAEAFTDALNHKIQNSGVQVFNPLNMLDTLTDPILRQSPLELLEAKEMFKLSMGMAAFEAATGNLTSDVARIDPSQPPEAVTREQLENMKGAYDFLNAMPSLSSNSQSNDTINELFDNAKELARVMEPMVKYADMVDMTYKELSEQFYAMPGEQDFSRMQAILDNNEKLLRELLFNDTANSIAAISAEFKEHPSLDVFASAATQLTADYHLNKELVLDSAGLTAFAQNVIDHEGPVMDAVDAKQKEIQTIHSEEYIRQENALTAKDYASESVGFVANQNPSDNDVSHLLTSITDSTVIAIPDNQKAVISTEHGFTSEDLTLLQTLTNLPDTAEAKNTLLLHFHPDDVAFIKEMNITPEDVQQWQTLLKEDAALDGKNPDNISTVKTLEAAIEYLNHKDFYPEASNSLRLQQDQQSEHTSDTLQDTPKKQNEHHELEQNDMSM